MQPFFVTVSNQSASPSPWESSSWGVLRQGCMDGRRRRRTVPRSLPQPMLLPSMCTTSCSCCRLLSGNDAGTAADQWTPSLFSTEGQLLPIIVD